MDSTTPSDTILTVDQLAELLRLNRHTIYDLIKAGEIPGCRKLGRRIRIHAPTVLAWLSTGQVSVSPSRRRKS